MVLTGGPGTGKTTTTQGIIAALKHMGLRILLAAPTGRAAKRMSEATGMEAKTIHRLLEFSPMEGYKRNEDNPLQGDALIVDECSMIDIILMNNLMKAIPHSWRSFCGRHRPITQCSAENVLRDIIESGIIPVIRLTRIFRQAQSSRIVMSAHAINQGKFPDISNGKATDFSLSNKRTGNGGFRNCQSGEKPPTKAYNQSASSIQVLTPMQRGIVGAANLNMALQQALNPSTTALHRGGYAFRQENPRDAVAQQL